MEFFELDIENTVEIKLDNLNLPQEVKDYVTNIYESDKVYFHEYPKYLSDVWGYLIPMSIIDDSETEIFNLFELIGFKVSNNVIVKYDICDKERGGYIVTNYDEKVLIIKFN